MDAYQNIRNKIHVTKRIYDFRQMLEFMSPELGMHCFKTSREFLEQWHIDLTERYNDMLKHHEMLRKPDDAQFYRLMTYWPSGDDCDVVCRLVDAWWTRLADEFHGSPALQALLTAWLDGLTHT